jgi:hypothetical protein
LRNKARKTTPSTAARLTSQQQTLVLAEGIVRLVLAVAIVLLIIWLIVVDPILSANAQIGLKALMALAFAALMSSMAGLIEIRGKHLGWVVRAAGGGAVFVIVWFTLPKIIGNLERRPLALLELGNLTAFDARSMTPPHGGSAGHGAVGVAITVPIDVSAVSDYDASLPATLKGAVLELSLQGRRIQLPWHYFVRQVPYERGGNWLSADPIHNAQAIAVSVGNPVKREVLFASPAGELTWNTFVSNLNDGNGFTIAVKWSLTDARGSRDISQSCDVTGRAERASIAAMLAGGNLPSRIVFQCET